MKKSFLILLSLIFLVSLSFAQNTATVTQTGDDNQATATQTGNNEAEIVQNGTWQKATLTQTTKNFGGIYQLNNGTNNEATVEQVGTDNKLWLNQGMEKDFWANKEAVEANWNTAAAFQNGSNNYGKLEQYGGTDASDGNNASLNQDGNNNLSYIYQGWAFSGWGETPTTSHLKSTRSEAHVAQYNDGNIAYAWQYGGDKNEVEITQNGNRNYASLVQGFIYTDLNYTFTTPVYNTHDNIAKLTQTGDDNKGKVMQLGDNNLFKLNQQNGSWVGYDPNASGLEASRNAYFHQDGNNNQFAGVVKNGNDLSYSDVADAEQLDGAVLDAGSEGISGYFGSFQKGDGNKIGLRQYDDTALIQQMGNDNTIVLWQDGSNNATVLQNGNTNSASVLQQ
ncbi:MAG: hypothetical protein Kow0037_02410 [Calditrichia bacterium]